MSSTGNVTVTENPSGSREIYCWRCETRAWAFSSIEAESIIKRHTSCQQNTPPRASGGTAIERKGGGRGQPVNPGRKYAPRPEPRKVALFGDES